MENDLVQRAACRPRAASSSLSRVRASAAGDERSTTTSLAIAKIISDRGIIICWKARNSLGFCLDSAHGSRGVDRRLAPKTSTHRLGGPSPTQTAHRGNTIAVRLRAFTTSAADDLNVCQNRIAGDTRCARARTANAWPKEP